MTEWAVELRDVMKTYRTGPIEVPALRGVNLRVAAREFMAIAGPSDSGKTTLLNIIGGLDQADAGEVWVEGENLRILSPGERARLRLRRLGFVFQAYNLLPVLTALENAEFTLLLQGVPAPRRRERVQKLFLEIGLAGLENRRPAELSGGQQQRVAVARDMVTEPALILFVIARTDTLGPRINAMDAAGDSITKAFNAKSEALCGNDDQKAASWSTSTSHGTDLCGVGGEGVFSQAEQLECRRGTNLIIADPDNAETGAQMLKDFVNQATKIKTFLSGQPGPRYVTVWLGHNDVCAGTLDKTAQPVREKGTKIPIITAARPRRRLSVNSVKGLISSSRCLS